MTKAPAAACKQKQAEIQVIPDLFSAIIIKLTQQFPGKYDIIMSLLLQERFAFSRDDQKQSFVNQFRNL